MITSMMRRALLSGDGSTLNVDFTTGVLDSRLTFTRASNATFINSSGYVEWANANMYWNTAFEGLSGTNPSLTGSGWGYVFSSGNAVFNGDGTVTVTTTSADRRVLFRSSGFSGNGLRVIAAIDVTISSGTLTASQVMVTGTPTNAQHYVNGTIWNSSHPLWNGGNLPVGTAFTLSYATDSLTGSTTSMWFGVGCSSAIAGSATFSNPRWTMWKGSGTVPYYPNTSATNNSSANYFKSNDYQAPRFDHDPTTLAPQGLLIEGTATNLINWSETFDTTGGATNWNWSSLNVTRGTVTTTNPTGATATVVKIEETTANGIHGTLTIPTVLASTTYTFSVWAKAVERTFVLLFENGGSGANSMVNLSTGAIVSESTTGITTVTALGTTGWYRISMRLTTIVGQTTANCQLRLSTNGTTTSYAGTTGSGIYIWGAQLEAGSGASSYLPTGASQASRSADTAIIAAGAAFTSWYTGDTSGTFYADWHGGVRSTTSTNRSVFSTSDVVNRHFHLMQTAAAGNLRVSDFGASSSVTTANAMTSGARTKGAFSFNVGSVKLCLNGGTVASGSVVFTTAPTYLVIGGTSTNGTSITDATVLLNGCIRQIKYWPTILPDAQLQSLTA